MTRYMTEIREWSLQKRVLQVGEMTRCQRLKSFGKNMAAVGIAP